MARLDSKVGRIQADSELDQRQSDAIRDRANDLSEVPISQGALVTDIELEDGVSKRIAHRLSAVPRGFILVSLEDATTAGYILTESSTKEFLTVQANDYGATVTVSLWVF